MYKEIIDHKFWKISTLVLGIFVLTSAIFKKNNTSPSVSTDQYLGEIMIFAGNFAPRDWVSCDGSLEQISYNQALFSIIDCAFGGDCRSTFAVPDLRGRFAVHKKESDIGYKFPGSYNPPINIASYARYALKPQTGGTSVNVASDLQQVTNYQPYLGMNFVMAVQGIFPQKN